MNTSTLLLIIALAIAIAVIIVLAAKLSAARDAMRTQRADFDRINAQAESRFADLAAKALAANSETLRQQNVHGMAQVLQPMKERLESFQRTFTERYDSEARERFALDGRLRELMDLNRTVSAETSRLTEALKGNSKLQGDWGEIILDNILQNAGLRRGYEYEVQDSITDEEGRRLRPDVVINYSEGRKIIVDSKVSIQDYLNMLNAATDAERENFSRAHIASVRKHVAELRRKNYQDAMPGAFDYVLMFIPHEGAFMAAMSLDNSLWQAAVDNRVLIISPTHLMAIVKLIENMWRSEKQNRNALEIAEEAGRMLDKFSAFLDDLDRIDKSINQSRDAWNSAYNKLTDGPGNLINRARKLEHLGAKTKKKLPPRYAADADE